MVVILLGCVSALALQRPQIGRYAKKVLKPWVAFVYIAAVLGGDPITPFKARPYSGDHDLFSSDYVHSNPS